MLLLFFRGIASYETESGMFFFGERVAAQHPTETKNKKKASLTKSTQYAQPSHVFKHD